MSKGGGGAGGSGTQKYEWNDTLAPMWKDVLGRGQLRMQDQYEDYRPDASWFGDSAVTGRVAGINDDQRAAMDRIRDLAIGNPERGSGTYESQNARDYLNNLLTGRMQQNPWNGSTPLDRQGGAGGAYNRWAQGNPLADAQKVPDAYQADKVQAGKNEFAGMDSPYFNKQLDTGLKKITDAYQKGTDAQTRRMFNLAGAFGGSAHQQAVNDNEKALGEQLGNYTQNMQQQQYDRSANLAEADISRRMQADQFNVNTGSGAYENWANRAFAGSGNDLARRGQMFENFLNRDMQSQQFNQNLGFQGWENMRNREMSGIPLAFQTEGMAMDRLRGLMGIGDAQRSYDQQIKDMTYNNWLAKTNYPKSQLDWFTGLLSRAQGGVAPNVTTQYPSTQISPFGALLGAGALYGAMR